jgi:abhydrolase domain-containing protein 14
MTKEIETKNKNIEPNIDLEETAKKEFFEHLDKFSRRQQHNYTLAAMMDNTANETLPEELEISKVDIGGLLNTSERLLLNDNTTRSYLNEDSVIEQPDVDLEQENENLQKDNITDLVKTYARKNKDTALGQEDRTNIMYNLEAENEMNFERDLQNTTKSTNTSQTLDILVRSNDTFLFEGQDREPQTRSLNSLKSRTQSSKYRKNRRKIKKHKLSDERNIDNTIPENHGHKLQSNVKKSRYQRNRKKHISKHTSLSNTRRHTKGGAHHKSSLHKAGHNGNREQHKSINPNRKMLMALKNNIRIDYNEGYVLEGTFFRQVKVKSVFKGTSHRRSVLLLHPSMFTSSVWVNIGTMQVLGESGYHAIAIDLPGYGRSNTSRIPYSRDEIIYYMMQLLQYLGLEKPVIVTPSKSGEYVMPLMMSHPGMIGGFVAISPTDTSKYSRHFYENLDVASLVVLGKEDESMLNWASLDSLEHLKIKRMFTIANATKECYVDRPSSFHKLLLNFLQTLHLHSYH